MDCKNKGTSLVAPTSFKTEVLLLPLHTCSDAYAAMYSNVKFPMTVRSHCLFWYQSDKLGCAGHAN